MANVVSKFWEHRHTKRSLPDLNISTPNVYSAEAFSGPDRQPEATDTPCPKCSYTRVGFNHRGDRFCCRCGAPHT